MKSDIFNLVKLQKLDDTIQAQESRLSKIPKEIQALEKEIAMERANLKAAEDRLTDALKHQRAHEGELASIEEKRSKFRDQLMNVKTNEEYRAMQKQIEVSTQEIGHTEEKILIGMDSLEELARERGSRVHELEKGQKEVAAMEKELKDEEAKLQTERAIQLEAREKILETIPEDLFGHYHTIAGTRGGVAMAAAVDERCQICMVRMRPQVFREIRTGDVLHHCDSCKRILYLAETEEAPAT